MDEKLITIVVCTHNREEILSECLNSLLDQSVVSKWFDVLVVDNNSTDSTTVIAKEYATLHENFNYVFEGQIGLSHARNRGYKESQTLWVGYLDDDAKAHKNYIERAYWVIDNYEFDGFGGRYLPWYRNTKPKWISEEFGTNGRLLSSPGILENNDISGGVSFFKKKILEQLNGFPTNLGMSGKKMGYGEENQLQANMRKDGYIVGFDPMLLVDHLVPLYKQNVSWILKSDFNKAKVFWEAHELKPDNLVRIKLAGKIIFFTSARMTINLFKILKKNYFWENFMIDTFSRTHSYLGLLIGSFKI